MGKKEIVEQQSYYVVKANALIQKTRYSFTAQQQKLLNFMISKIKPEDKPETEYKIRMVDFCRVCGIIQTAADKESKKELSGYYYKSIKDDLAVLSDTATWIEIDKNRETRARWLSHITIEKNTGTIYYEFDRFMYPYLFELKERFTEYSGELTYCLSSQYAIRLYEILKSFEWEGKMKRIELDELKNRMYITSYDRFPDFRRRVLEPAIKEINKGTDIKVRYEQITDGRSVVALRFFYEELSTDEINNRRDWRYSVLKIDS